MKKITFLAVTCNQAQAYKVQAFTNISAKVKLQKNLDKILRITFVCLDQFRAGFSSLNDRKSK